MKKVLFFVLTAVLFFATSCLNGGNTGGSSSAEYYGQLTVTDTETGEISYFDEASQVIVTIPNSYEAKFDIVFKGVKFDKMMPALKSIQVGLLCANSELVEIFMVGTKVPKGVPRPVVNSTM